MLSHEVMHVVQFYRDPFGFLRRYLTSRGRAELEAEAERARLEVCWILWGALPSLDDIVARSWPSKMIRPWLAPYRPTRRRATVDLPPK